MLQLTSRLYHDCLQILCFQRHRLVRMKLFDHWHRTNILHEWFYQILAWLLDFVVWPHDWHSAHAPKKYKVIKFLMLLNKLLSDKHTCCNVPHWVPNDIRSTIWLLSPPISKHDWGFPVANTLPANGFPKLIVTNMSDGVHSTLTEKRNKFLKVNYI